MADRPYHFFSSFDIHILFALWKIVIGFKSTFTMYNGKNNKQKLSCFP